MRGASVHAALIAIVVFVGSAACRRTKSNGDDGGATSAASSVAAASTRTVLSPEIAAEAGADQLIHLNRYTKGARQLVRSAQSLADERHHKTMTTLHMMARYLALPPVEQSFRDAQADPALAAKLVELELARQPTSTWPSFLSTDVLAVLQKAEREAGAQPVSLTDLINASVGFGTPHAWSTVQDLGLAGLSRSLEYEQVKRVVEGARLARILRAADGGPPSSMPGSTRTGSSADPP